MGLCRRKKRKTAQKRVPKRRRRRRRRTRSRVVGIIRFRGSGGGVVVLVDSGEFALSSVDNDFFAEELSVALRACAPNGGALPEMFS